MRTLTRTFRLLIFPGLLILTSAAFGAPKTDAGSAIDANRAGIENQVQHKLAMLPWYGVFDNIKFEVKGTEVILTGQVVSEHDRTKYDAENEVKRIPGVTKAVNDIQVLPPSTFDDQIRRAEFRAIFSKSDLGRYTMGAIPQVHIIVSGGHVALEGTVMNEMDRDVAGIVANTVPGVFSVTNNLQVG